VTDRAGTGKTGRTNQRGARARGKPRQINTILRTPSARRATLAITAAFLAGACGRSPEEPVTPGSLGITTGNNQTGVVGTTLPTTLAVVVRDTRGRLITGQRVDWDVAAGAGTVSPASSRTDATGVAVTTWTLGTTAGVGRVSAQVTGVNPVTFAATVLAGPAAAVIATPDEAAIGIGDTLRLRAAVRDSYGNALTGPAITWSSLAPAVATVASSGVVTGVTAGLARIVAEANGRADTVPVTVSTAGVCGTASPRALGVGEAVVPAAGTSSAVLCVAAPAGPSAEYALSVISTAPSFGTTTPVDVIAIGSTAPTLPTLVAPPEPSLDAPALEAVRAPWRVEAARRERERALLPLVPEARAWHAERLAERARRPALLAEVKVGDVLRLNANANQSCSSADLRNARVAAVGANAIVAVDQDNPSGGYTDAELVAVAATFDTLVYPLDTAAFGPPTNISGHGKVILFYTSRVNALTPALASYTVGGFFYARDLYPKVSRGGLAACASSNEAEMFYLLVPDPNGTINGNRRTKDEVTLLNLTTIAHEFQHLINAGRRLYVTPGAAPTEETWLDEGLSHVAEELLYWRVLGVGSRQNLGIGDVGGSTARSDLFRNYASQNFSRFYQFLVNPEANSPYAPNDSLATRGAIWTFLRFAAGRQGASGEAPFFRALVNSTTRGVANLQGVLGTGTFADYLQDWAVSLVADDFSATQAPLLDTRYRLVAWNFRSIYPSLRFGSSAVLGAYPLNARGLPSNAPARLSLAGGTSAYFRFGVPAGTNAILRVSSNGAVPGSTLRMVVTRLR
jgi:hypothetical protein